MTKNVRLIFFTFIGDTLPSFSSAFFAEESLDGLLHRHASSTTHLLLQLQLDGLLLSSHPLLLFFLSASVYLEVMKTASVLKKISFRNRSPQ